MKTNLLYVISLLFMPACTQKVQAPNQAESVIISILRDRTDVHMIEPDESILSLYDFKKHPMQEAYFRLQDITDMQLSQVNTLHVPETTENDDNIKRDPWYRERLILSFYDSVRHLLHIESTSGTAELEQSYCYKKIRDELKFLAAHRKEKKALLIYSNLLENNTAFSCFNASSKKLLQTNPEEVEALLSKKFGAIPNLSGIDVYVLYLPKKENEANFLLMYDMYKTLLELKGAHVFFGTSNQALQLN